LNRLSGTQTHS